MYNIRQFKPALYVLLVLGTSGFALASQSPATFVLGAVGILSNAWLVYVGRFAPLPRLLANVITLGATAYVAQRVLASSVTPVLVIGQFLVLLQLIKLWEQRANRDYAQLLVLSLLLMVAAAISTASLVFGVLLVVYLFLSLYCCLLFHLKTETDAAKAALALPEDKLSPEALRQDQRYLSGSMRRLTGFVSAVAIGMAVVVFLFFPRGTGAGVLGPMQLQAGQTLTGFSDQVGFQKIAQIQQNQEIMAYVQVWHNGQKVNGERTILLRGTTLDRYTGNGSMGSRPWEWIRSLRHATPLGAPADETQWLYGPDPVEDEWRQVISFRRPTGTTTLFAMEGLSSFRPRRNMDLKFWKHDGVLHTNLPAPSGPFEYEAISRGHLDPPGLMARLESAYGRRRSSASVINPRVTEYARRPEVSGADARGPLAARRTAEAAAAAEARNGAAAGAGAAAGPPRMPEPVTHPLDEQIARNIEQHLSSTFAYTLDLTDARRIIEDQDPMVAFLYDLKRGHCEYFAGAMALMCQSLGMEARVVTGFKCDEYNEFSGQYVVRQAHAHAWVEARTAGGWKTFDPTSAREVVQSTTTQTLWGKVKHLFNYLEFQYGNSVIAYDNENQENLVQSMETGMTRTAWRGAEAIRKFREWLDPGKNFWAISSNLLLALVATLAMIPVALGLWILVERIRLHRRAARIGLESLPEREQMKLVRQLAFYDDLVRLLGRHGIHRPAHLTPLEFSQSLIYLPNGPYDTINRLTELFYRVRFGRTELSPGQHRKLHTAVTELATCLGGTPSAAAAASSAPAYLK